MAASGVSDALQNLTLQDERVEPLAKPPLKIAAFNIRVLGSKKLEQKDVTDILLKIISRYDLVLVQEVRDKSQTAIDFLVKKLNELEVDDPFGCMESERLGRTHSKEQYVFLYRKSRLEITDSYQYEDGVDDGTDVFQREPFAVRISSPTTAVKDFGVIAIHTAPDDAVKEIGALHKVYEVTKKHWDLEDILIAGDFNADEGYVDQDDWSNIALRTDRRFKWLIDDETDTTVGNTDRAYDRFVVVGPNLKRGVIPGSAKAYRFDDELNLTTEEAEDVSDHYPIEMELYGEVNRDIQQNLSTAISVTIKQTQPIDSINDARQIYREDDAEQTLGFDVLLLKKDTSMHEVRATKTNVENVVATLRDFQSAFPGVVNDDTVSMTSAYMTSPVMMSSPVVYGLDKVSGSGEYDVAVTVTLQEPCLCEVTVTRRVS